MVCMASFLPSNNRISPHFEISHLKLPTYAYFMVLSLIPCSQNIKLLKIDFHDVITNEIYNKDHSVYRQYRYIHRKLGGLY